MMVIRSYKDLGREPMVGDRVKIVSTKSGNYWNSDGNMDHHLDTIMTVKKVESDWHGWRLRLKESYGEHLEEGWAWYPWMIEGVVIDAIEDILEDPSTWASGDALDALLT